MNLEEADKFVVNNPDAFWENYTLVIHQPNPRAYMHVAGRFHNGTWGFERRVQCNSEGLWTV